MTKFRDAGAYEVAEGVSAEEAAELGLAVVEVDATSGRPTAYGRYKDAPKGAPLGITKDKPGETAIVGGGGVAAPVEGAGLGEAAKGIPGSDDPIARPVPGQETIHADGAAPGKLAKQRDAEDVLSESLKAIEDADAKKKK